MASEYKSPFSVSKRQTIFLDVNDPRVKSYKAGLTSARAGAEIVIVDGSGGAVLSSSYAANLVGRKSPTFAGTPIASDGKTPGSITNLSAVWQGTSLIFSFDIDLTSTDNDGIDSFFYTLADSEVVTSPIQSTKLNKTSVSQQIIFDNADNAKYFGDFQGSFVEFRVRAHDKSGNLGPEAVLTNIPVYDNGLPAPVITVTSIIQGYSVDWVQIPQDYTHISVEEIVSDAGTAPTSGYQQVHLGLKSIKPAVVTTPTTEARWVKARFVAPGSGTYGPYSNVVKVTPLNPVSVDLTPPNEVTVNSSTWSGDNIVISYTLPATDAGVRFKVALTAPNSSVGFFYFFPVVGTNNQTATITKADLFNQFGTHYSSFSGVFYSMDSSDNRSAGVSFSVAQRANPLLGITPIFTTTALVNGYNVSFTLPASATYAEVYQKYSSWTGVTPVDSFTGTYLSGGASGTNTVTLSGVVSNKGVAVSPIAGYRVIGDGIPNNTYITAVSGNQITVNNNFTSQVSGSVTGYSVVYSGSGPANISSTIYENTYLLVRYYDDFENPSNYSAEQIVVPLQPVAVDISGPGSVATVNTPSSGIDTSGTLGFNGFIDLSWSSVADSTLRGYRIRFTTDLISADPVYQYADYPIDQNNPPTGTISYRLAGLAVGATYKLGVATYDEFNNTSLSYTNFANTLIAGTPAITDYITAGNFQFGQGVDPLNTTGITGTKRGLFFDNSNYWFLNSLDSARLKVGGSTSNYILWDGTKFTIDGDITARGGSFSGNIALTTSGASIFSGDVTTSPGNLTGDGFIFNKDGLLIRKGTNQVSLDTTTGSITANAGNIAGWTIDDSKIERQDPSTTKWAGLSSTGTYKFWAGSNVSTGDITQFAVDNTGKVFASSVQISGGRLDIGASPSNLSSGFHVLTDGTMYSTGAIINGAITATSGSIQGNFQVISGSFFTGTSPTSTSVIINNQGLASIGANNVTLTAIVNTPITSGFIPLGDNPSVGNLPSQITFFTKAALIGGWVVNDTSIRDRSQQFILDSADKLLTIAGTDNSIQYTVKLGTGFAGVVSGTRAIFEAGRAGQNPNFYVTTEGKIFANDASLQGILTTDSAGTAMKFGKSAGGAGNDGIYIDPNDYWYKDGSFSLGSGILSGTASLVDINLTSGNGVRFLNMPSSDDDNFAGDPTITIRPSDSKLVKGRRFIFNGSGNIPINPNTNSGPYTWNDITNVGTFRTAGGTDTEVKTGDIVMIY